jgi:hypothetical protein
MRCCIALYSQVLLVFANSAAQVWAARTCTGFAVGLLHQVRLQPK